MLMDPLVSLVAALLLSYIFAVAALHKWQAMEEFRATLENYRLLPALLLAPAAVVLPLAETVTGLALLIPSTSNYAAVLAALLLLLYIIGIGVNLLRGRRTIDCGCGGSDQRQNISEWLIVRNLVLLGLTYIVIAPETSRTLLWLDWLVVVMATLAACLVYNVFNQLLVNRDFLNILRS